MVRLQMLLVFAVLVAFGLFCAPTARAATGCPGGYTQVGEKKTDTGTAIITQPLCMSDDDAVACKNLRNQIDQIIAVARRANLALDVYSFYDQTGGWQAPWKAPSGFTLASNDIAADRAMFPGKSDAEITELLAPAGSSYRAAIYRDDKTHDLFLVFRGTTEQLEDWTSGNVPNEEGKWSAYFDKAQTLAKLVKQSANRSGVKLEIIGHSLGGGMATAAALAATAKATVFNAESFRSEVSPNPTTNEAAVADALVTNYVTPGEIVTMFQGSGQTGLVSKIGQALGRKVTLPDWPGSPTWSPIERHLMRSVRLALQNNLELLQKRYDDDGCAP